MLLFKYQIGAVMGKKGATINEIRNKSGATVKLTTPQGGAPIVPCAERDDELITVRGKALHDAVMVWCVACCRLRAGRAVEDQQHC
jgi:polyribonucleotide nucleotidyltransferase